MNETEMCVFYAVKQAYPSTVRIFIFIRLTVDIILALTAILGNGVIIVAILRSQNLQTPSYLLITRLAFTDLLVGLVYHPLDIAVTMLYWHNKVQSVCDATSVLMLATTFFGALLFAMVTCISIDRYLALTLKHQYTIIVTKKRIRLLIVLVWTFFVLFVVLLPLEHLYKIFCIIAFPVTVILLSITCVCYIKSFRALHLYTAQVHAQQPNPLSGNFDVVRYKKTLKTMLVVFACLLLCFVPSVCTIVALVLKGVGKELITLYSVSATLLGLHSSINPIIYVGRFADIRNACRYTEICIHCSYLFISL